MAKRVRRQQREEKEEEDFFDDFRDLEKGLAIDEHALEEALSEQPSLFYRVANAYALAVSRRDAAKQAVADAEAEADLAVRELAEQQERKLTEGHVKAEVATDRGVVRARDRFAEYSGIAARLNALKDAFQQRSYALKDLASLYVANYYTASDQNNVRHELRDRAGRDGRRAMSEERSSRRI